MLSLFKCVIALCLLLLSPAFAASDNQCLLQQLTPTRSEPVVVEQSQKSQLTMVSGLNRYLLTCNLTESGVFTFQRPGITEHQWLENDNVKTPIRASEIAYSMPAGNVSAVIYIHATLDYTPRFSWYTATDYLNISQKHALVLGIFYGLGITLILLAFTIGFSARSNAIMLYGLYILCLTAFFLLQEGQLFIFTGEAIATVHNQAFLLSIGLTVLSATWFLSLILELPSSYPRLTASLYILAAVVFLLAVARLFVLPAPIWQVTGIIMSYSTLCIVLGIFVLAMLQAYRGVPEARLICIALAIVLASMIFRIVLINYSPFMQRYGFILAFSIEALLLAVALARRVSRIATARDNALRDATIDPLCGIANRRGISNQLRNMARGALSSTRQYAAFYIDVDNFKAVNDTYGHHIGDSALQSVANALKMHLTQAEIIGRLGGDEFIAVAAFPDTDTAQQAFSALQTQLGALVIATTQGSMTISASVGCTLLKTVPADLAELITESDHAMYQEKARKKRAV